MNARYCLQRQPAWLSSAVFILLMLYAVLVLIRPARAETLVVATDTAFVPFEFREHGQYVGFDMDLLELIVNDMGVTYTLLPMDFANIFPSLTSGKVDMAIAGITITQDRERSVDFSAPYFHSDISLVVAAENTGIRHFADLAGKRVGLKRGTDAADYIRQTLPQAEVTYFQNMDGDFPYLEVAAGRLDALVHDTPNVRYFSQNQGRGLVKVVDTVATVNNFYAIATPKNSALTQRVNTALHKVIQSEDYINIYRKWFGVLPEPLIQIQAEEDRR